MKKRATPPERITGRMFREAVATVRQNVFLRDMNVEVGEDDARQTEVLAQDLHCYGGVQLAVDMTLRFDLPRRSPHARRRHRWSHVDEGTCGQRGSVPRVGHVRALQTDCHGRGNWRTVE